MRKARGIRSYIDPKSNTGKILNTATLDMLELSETGVIIFTMIERGDSYHDILRNLETTYPDVPLQTIEADLHTFLEELESCRMIEGDLL